jgi:hypothetical protein
MINNFPQIFREEGLSALACPLAKKSSARAEHYLKVGSTMTCAIASKPSAYPPTALCILLYRSIDFKSQTKTYAYTMHTLPIIFSLFQVLADL